MKHLRFKRGVWLVCAFSENRASTKVYATDSGKETPTSCFWLTQVRARKGARRVFGSLSTPMGVDYVAIGFDVDVQPLVTHNAAWLVVLFYVHGKYLRSCRDGQLT